MAQADNPPSIDRSDDTRKAMRYRFSSADERLLDEIQHACFLFFWKEVGSPANLAKDRMKAPVASSAAVGFQLSSLPIGVERGWITRDQGAERARTVLTSLLERKDNKKFGIYLHYPDYDTAGLSTSAYEVLASTVDTALLIAGAMPAGEYFGGDVAKLVDRLIAEANWKAFANGPDSRVNMGWRPDDRTSMDGPGTFHGSHWNIASDEEHIIYFLAVGSPNPDHALPPRTYYTTSRLIKQHKEMPPFVVSWNGALFTYVFSHCWIDFRRFGTDNPSRFGVDAPGVDWFENSRRAYLTHRQRCLEQVGRFKSFADDRWGLSACVGRDSYLVPEVKPNMVDADQWCDGTVAPYAAGCGLMFTPEESMAALRAFRTLKNSAGEPMVWWDPAKGGYGLVDAFNLDQDYRAEDYVGIDHGPMLLAIENARTGLIWDLFMRHPAARRAVERLKLAD